MPHRRRCRRLSLHLSGSRRRRGRWPASGTAARAIQHVGAEAVRQAIIDSLPPYQMPDGSYRQHNIFRYVIASP